MHMSSSHANHKFFFYIRWYLQLLTPVTGCLEYTDFRRQIIMSISCFHADKLFISNSEYLEFIQNAFYKCIRNKKISIFFSRM